MIDIPDVNVLLALHVPGYPRHADAIDWLQRVERFATTPVTEMGLVRLLMNPKVMGGRPDTAAEAMHTLRSLKNRSHALFIADDAQFDQSRFEYALSGSHQVTDLHLLDLAARVGGRLVTLDAKLQAALRPDDRKHLLLLEP